jgi:hypothetical protein
MRSGGGTISLRIAGKNHDADIIGTGIQGFLDDDGQRSFGFAVAIHEGLQRQSPLAWAGRGDDSFVNFHNS